MEGGKTSNVLSDNPINTMFGNNEQNRASGEAANNAEWSGLSGIANNMAQSGANYTTSATDANANYQNAMSGLAGQSQSAANNANQVYNSVQSGLTTLSDQAQKNASGAMTLQQMEDPNNSVASATRDMYNNQAQGMQQAGTANVGVMQSLGAQATAQQLGSMGLPTTGAQMQSMMAANQGQAGTAMANVQNQVNNLKLQGIQQGQNQSNLAYQNGQQAVGTASGLEQARQGASSQNVGVQQGLRGEQAGYAGNEQNSAQNLAGLNYGVAQNNANAQAGILTGQTGANEALYNANIARNNGVMNMIPGASSALGGAYGNYYGGAPQEQNSGGFGQMMGVGQMMAQV
jgi:hypothetical protein